MKKIHADEFRVHAGRKVDLSKWPTKLKPVYSSREEYKALLADHIGKLRARRQSLLYACNQYAVCC